MEGVFLSALGGGHTPRVPRPQMGLADLDNRTHFLQASAIEHSTRKNYATGARDYILFCVNHNLPLNPTPETLSRYIAFTSQFIASAPSYLSGARHFLSQIYPDFEQNRAHPTVQATIAGARKVWADPIRRKLPLRTAHLLSFLHIADISDDYDDYLFAVILSCAFYACHRMGELLWPNTKSLRDWRKVIKRGSLHLHDSRAQYLLPYHKGDRFYRGTEILFTRQDTADPVSLLIKYTARRDALHGAKAALFMCADGSIPTWAWFDRRFFKCLDRSFGGHSARAGRATFYASLGLSEDVIQALGRWSSETWKTYIRENPTVRAEAQIAAIRLRS
jgi:hypothetical protein